ncbi:hypothetical protein ACFFMS_23855 [Ectobacillus funiculus]|uniref:Uncharacterized protein n=1 Tax=Ectobacillus funiculus TaxID=137993 RepID=A0ABV5WM72_9BACI
MCGENSPIGEPLGEDRGIVALTLYNKISDYVESLLAGNLYFSTV